MNVRGSSGMRVGLDDAVHVKPLLQNRLSKNRKAAEECRERRKMRVRA